MDPQNFTLSDSNNLNDMLELNTKLMKYYKPFSIYSTQTIVNEKKKFIIDIYHNDLLVLRAEYVPIGSYSPEMNVWIWSDQSLVLDKKIVEYVSKLRSNMMNLATNKNNKEYDKFKKFVELKYSVLPIGEVYFNLCTFESFLSTEKIITYHNSGTVDIIMIKKILLSNLKE